MRLELQMALDSKDSDIEQLRGQLSTLSVHSLDSTSISSGNDMDMDGYPGRKWAGSGGKLRLCSSAPLSLSLTPPLLPGRLSPTSRSLYHFLCSFLHLRVSPCTVRITHSHTSESMSFTYQRTHKSVCIDTRPDLRSARPLFDSEDEEEDEDCASGQGQGQQPPALTYDRPCRPECAGDPAWQSDPQG